MAAPVSESVARQQAETFLAERGKMIAGMSAAPGRPTSPSQSDSNSNPEEPFAPYYAFNVGNDGGFVVVSGDDSVEPILGYADEGYIDLNDLPDGLQYMLDCYAASPARTPVIVQRTVRAPIAPLIETKWSQRDPYNRCTPYDSNANSHTPTGCVATAMAQVMKYWNWPQTACQPLPGYRPILSPNDTVAPVPATTFDWANMLPIHTGDESEAEQDAVAKLMEYCGKALQTRYRSSSSSAYAMSISYVLKTYFDYDPGVSFVHREHYSYAEWVELLYNELAAGRPLCYSGQSAGGGHSFVCDGYDSDDYFHFNWGWSGKSDGYFRLVDPNPYDQGTGGSSTDDGYSMDQRVTIGIQPSTQPSGKNYCLMLDEIYSYMRSGHQNIRFRLHSHCNGTNLFDMNLRLYNPDGTLHRDLWTWEQESIACFYATYLYYHFYDDNVADGTYQVRLFSRLHGESEWKECMGWESQPLTLTVTNGHDTTTTPHPAYIHPVDATFSVEGTPTVGSRLTVTAHLTGGEVDYNDNLILYVNGQKKMGLQAEIPAGETRDLVFWYVPTAAGNDTLKLYADEDFYYPIGSDTVITIQSAGEISDRVAMNKTFVVHNVKNKRLYGGHLQASVICSNPSADTTYIGSIYVYCFEKLPGATKWVNHAVANRDITVRPLGSVVFDIDEAGKVAGAQYALRAYTYRDTIGGSVWEYTTSDKYYMDAGYELFDAEGCSTLYPLSDTLNMGEATFADLRMLTDADTVNCFVPSSNPNCVYLLNDTATLAWAVGLPNSVQGGVADSITLLDGHAFFTPVEFTATNILYRRPYSVGAGTLCLPFDVPQVPGGLLAFEYEIPGDVVFSGVYHSLQANTPYLFIGDRHSTADSILLFVGSNATIQPSRVATRSGNYYTFSGSTFVMALEDVYVEGENGFSHQDYALSVPFRAWFRDSEITPYPVELLDLHLLPTDLHATEENGLSGKKFIRDGRLYLLRDGILYDALGRTVKR